MNSFELKVKVSYVFLFLILCVGAWSVLLVMGGEVNYTEKQTYSALGGVVAIVAFCHGMLYIRPTSSSCLYMDKG